MTGRDVTARLRERGRWVTTKRVPLIPQMDEETWVGDDLCHEAAAEIDRLRDLLNSAADALANYYDEESYAEEGLIQLIEAALGNGSRKRQPNPSVNGSSRAGA